MYLNHKERLIQCPELNDFSKWPKIHYSEIDKNKRKKYLRNCRAIKLALENYRYEDIKTATGISISSITRLLSRSLAGEDNAEPALTKALIPGYHVHKSVRRSNLCKIGEKVGARSSFQYLLDTVPGLQKKLDKILKAYLNDNPRSQNITPKNFHSSFLLFLDEGNHPNDSYPYSESELGYESVRLYLHKRLDELRLEKIIRQQPKRIISPRTTDFAYGREIQIDEYIYDAKSSIYLNFNDDYIPTRIGRFSVIVVSDKDTTCNLSYHIALTQHCSQYDILIALENACTYSEPRKLNTPTISYPSGDIFPNCISKEYARIAFNSVALDNSLAHHANTVRDYICNTHCGTRSLGLVKQPKRRNVVEYAFKILSQVAKRFNSTSGKNPSDPVKESINNQKKAPIFTLKNFEDVIAVNLATHNVTPQKQHMMNTPIELCKHHRATKLLRLIPMQMYENITFNVIRCKVTLKWLKNEGRAPHINFYGCRYYVQHLSDTQYINKTIEIRYNFSDIRSLDIYSITGEKIGIALAPKSWQRFPHSVKTRQYILKYCRTFKRHFKDPLTEFFWLQLQRKNKEKSALEVARLYMEYSVGEPTFDSNNSTLETADAVKNVSQDIQKNSKFPAWDTTIASHVRDNL